MSLRRPTLQELLDREANASNSGNIEERNRLRGLIIEKRGLTAPPCWGQDDCSTMTMVRCPWRIDCGEIINVWNE